MLRMTELKYDCHLQKDLSHEILHGHRFRHMKVYDAFAEASSSL